MRPKTKSIKTNKPQGQSPLATETNKTGKNPLQTKGTRKPPTVSNLDKAVDKETPLPPVAKGPSAQELTQITKYVPEKKSVKNVKNRDAEADSVGKYAKQGKKDVAEERAARRTNIKDPAPSTDMVVMPLPERVTPAKKTRTDTEEVPVVAPSTKSSTKRKNKKLPFQEQPLKKIAMPFSEPTSIVEDEEQRAPVPAPRSRTVAEPRTAESRKRSSPAPPPAVDEATYRDVAANILRIAYVSGEGPDQLYHPEAETHANIFANEMIRDGLDARRLAEYVRDAASRSGRPLPSVQVKKGGKFVFGRGLKAGLRS